MIEREMGNRGSKSLYLKPTKAKWYNVKEQRVDGSCVDFIANKSALRYTLMGLKRDYPIKILSKQNRLYCTNSYSKFDPWFITGFADAESTFNILVQPRSDSKTKWRVKAIFAIGLNKKDQQILEDIKSWFGVGHIYLSATKVYYRVESFKELEVIINHFDNYRLVTAKKLDYDLFKRSFDLIKLNKHLTEEGTSELIEIKSSLNKGLSENLKTSFSKANLLEREIFVFSGIPSPYWISGFVSGDGSFNIKTTKTRTGKVQLRFAVNLHIREEDVIKGIGKFFNFDVNKYIYYTDSSVAIQIVNTHDNLNTVIPFFNKYAIKGLKELDYNDFKKVAVLIESKKHLTEDGFNEILRIKDNMNLNRT